MAWVNAVDQWEHWSNEPFRLIQNTGRGMIATGTREWRDYRVSTVVQPALLKTGGIAARVQGLLRFYALQLTNQKTIRLLRVYDGTEEVLAETPYDWQLWQPVSLSLEVKGSHLRAWVAEKQVFDLEDSGTPLTEGAIGLILEEGHMIAGAVKITPA